MEPLYCCQEEQTSPGPQRLPRVKDLRGSQEEVSYLDKCRRRCVEEGLENNTVRRAVWRHVVLGLDRPMRVFCVQESRSEGSSQGPSSATSVDTPRLRTTAIEKEECVESGKKTVDLQKSLDNCDLRVIQVDVQRSLWLLYRDHSKREIMRDVLKNLLQHVLLNNSERHYYQGLHELMGFVMYVMEGASMNVLAAVCESLLRVQWKSFSDKKLRQSESMLYAVHAVLAEEDVELATTLESCGVAPESHYIVGWLITWYTHVCEDTKVVARLFDFLIGHADEHTVIFFTAALLLHERERIIGYVREARAGAEDDDDNLTIMANVYKQLTRLPKEVLTTRNWVAFGEMLRHTVALQGKHLACVKEAREEFLRGNVKKRGMLADERTRNSALKLLWSFLFREWRKPWKGKHISVPLMGAVLFGVFAVAVSLTTCDSVQLIMRNYFSFDE
ncbi:putative TBC1 domain family member 20/GTPase [Trypanosoma cruzi]|uniref:GTPase activating protein of Rab-like GTPase, putative n=2 Tax=Trypanosoma cruzi TaxID=5693 RepID=Q4D5H4_TRYCC|nr:GTPase activating protein of Rab-like GTPase, putative [Trypanosoma cruzi]EAN87767.1 GTPase activating protein of Rab-like GTPase, putative [Trypanosoma cruzi]PWV07380.1 putative TBC1 domain family member 20/GTPase [Trypanosoma cruzi]RNC42893.1 putative GTPase activating protein of Rab-like GTPase [Trypanosoma cruzi]|eukprot:XP_809618.1 GTPase activating protein of Rab-like GTPase [Trypanosoma cruzi strain CL Brener]